MARDLVGAEQRRKWCELNSNCSKSESKTILIKLNNLRRV